MICLFIYYDFIKNISHGDIMGTTIGGIGGIYPPLVRGGIIGLLSPTRVLPHITNTYI